MNKLLLLALLAFTAGCSLTDVGPFQSTEIISPTSAQHPPIDEAEPALTTENTPPSTPSVEVAPAVQVIMQPSEVCQEALVERRKNVIGEVEYIQLVRENLGYDARIDTGATTSSLGVFNLMEFERDGKKWVKFTLENTTEDNKPATRAAEKAPEPKVYEYPVTRSSQIKTHSSKKSVRRPVITMLMRLGDKNYNAEFSLTDRSYMTYKILIGREFLRDRVIVDVSQKHMMQGK